MPRGIGLHLFAGGMLATILGALEPLQAECKGPQCVVGMDSEFLGAFIGIPVAIVGFVVRGRA